MNYNYYVQFVWKPLLKLLQIAIINFVFAVCLVLKYVRYVVLHYK